MRQVGKFWHICFFFGSFHAAFRVVLLGGVASGRAGVCPLRVHPPRSEASCPAQRPVTVRLHCVMSPPASRGRATEERARQAGTSRHWLAYEDSLCPVLNKQ